jgi:acyl carrier protein
MKDYLVEKIEEISFERVELNDSLWQSGVLDSITIVELAVDLEEEFKIEIPFDEIIEDNFETLANLIAFIKKKQNG